MSSSGSGAKADGMHARFLAVVRRIPKGRVATYGQVARLAGLPGRARQVGWALHSSGDHPGIPWHRVINSRGEVSERSAPGYDRLQQQLLEREGIEFDERGRIALTRYGWKPRSR
jgi:methylated-DNA-protein-cysteine methyltransferase-like protein